MGFLDKLDSIKEEFEAKTRHIPREAVDRFIKEESERILHKAYAAEPIRVRQWHWTPGPYGSFYGTPDIEPDDENVVEADGFRVLPPRLLPEKAGDA